MIFLFISRRIWYTMNLVSHSIRGLDDQNNAIHKRGKRKMESSAACLNELRDLGTLTRKKKNDCLYNRAHLDKYVYCLEEGLVHSTAFLPAAGNGSISIFSPVTSSVLYRPTPDLTPTTPFMHFQSRQNPRACCIRYHITHSVNTWSLIPTFTGGSLRLPSRITTMH